MLEAGVLLDLKGEPICFWAPPERTMIDLPDSLDLWNIFWENRENISGFAHSHPGCGLPHPSWKDITTFSAVKLGLGFDLDWPIISKDSMILVKYVGPNKYDYDYLPVRAEPNWVHGLRKITNYYK